MAHTLTLLLTHVVFSTKERRAWLNAALRPALFAYLGGIARELDATTLIVNGVEDHVHLLVSYPASLALAELVRVLRANSSLWLHRTHRAGFAWQSGYGAFSVSHSAREAVINYIARQETRHRRVSLPRSSERCCNTTRSSTMSGSCSRNLAHGPFLRPCRGWPQP